MGKGQLAVRQEKAENEELHLRIFRLIGGVIRHCGEQQHPLSAARETGRSQAFLTSLGLE